MAEALAIVGLVSAIAQFVDLSSKIIERLAEFQSSFDDAPQTFRDLLVQLPLLRETLKETRRHAETGIINVETQEAVLQVVKECQWQVQRLDDILVKVIPAAGDSRLKRGVKAFKSVSQDREVQSIMARIQRYQISLIHYQTSPATQALPVRKRPLFTVPFGRDPRFTGRQDQMNDIDTLFKAHGRVALAGLGGVGKSQIAIEHCYRYRQSYPLGSVLWIHSSNVERVDQAYKEIARNAQLPGWQDPKTNKFELVADWLTQEETGRWLIVLDNADDEDVFFSMGHNVLSGAQNKSVATYIPHSKEGSVLITTRDRRLGQRLANRLQPINVPPFNLQESVSLFGSLVGPAGFDDERDISQLLEILAYLPLAISQAAAFITENSIRVSEYLELLRQGEAGMKELLSEELTDDRRDRETQNSVIRTWKISFDYIRKSKPRAAEILSLVSMLDRQGIPKSLLCSDSESSIDFTKTIGTLQAFSLITPDSSYVNVEVHRLVHLATQKWLELEGEIKRWREEALKVMSEHYPVGTFENWAACNALTAHVQAVVEYAGDSESSQLYVANILAKTVRYDLLQGRHKVALDKCIRVLSIRKALLGEEHIDTLSGISNLASTYWNQGRWKEAETLEQKLLETRKRVLGEEHPDTLTSLANLAVTYWNQGRGKEAETLQEKALEIMKRVSGEEHPDTLSSMGNLALTYRDQGRLKEAEKLQEKVLDIRKRVLGEEYPSTLTSMANLAVAYWNQGRLKEAETLQEKVLEIRKRVLGEEHPGTLTNMANLASTYESQGRWREAVTLEEKVLEIRKRVLGEEHPDTMTSMANLAVNYWNQERWSEAETLEEKALEKRKRVLGEEHLDTLVSMGNLASTYQSQGRSKEAETLQEKVLEIRKRVSGEEHPDTLASMGNLTLTYQNQGRWEEAETLQQKVLEMRKRVLGEEHLHTLVSMVNLAVTYWSQGRWREAETLEEKVLETRTRVLGEEHPDTLSIMENLSRTLKSQDRNEEGIALMSRCVQLRGSVLGVDHPQTKRSSSILTSWQE